MRMRVWTTSLALGCIVASAHAQTLPSTGIRAVPTYEAVGIYWSSPGATSAGCDVQYRKAGDSAWHSGLGLVYDATAAECRGSLMNLSAGTAYEAQLAIAGQAASRAITFSTWPN